MRTFRRSVAAGLATLMLTALGTASAAAAAPGAGEYTDPEFGADCTFHHFGEGETPPLDLIGTEPLCVEYAKRDITVSNGGAARFVLAEPARFAVALPACQYWQVDHWSVQTRPGDPAVVGWDGSYWFDKASGTAALRATGITVAGQPADASEAADVLRPHDPQLADALERAADGVKVQLPVSLPCFGI